MWSVSCDGRDVSWDPWADLVGDAVDGCHAERKEVLGEQLQGFQVAVDAVKAEAVLGSRHEDVSVLEEHRHSDIIRQSGGVVDDDLLHPPDGAHTPKAVLVG